MKLGRCEKKGGNVDVEARRKIGKGGEATLAKRDYVG